MSGTDSSALETRLAVAEETLRALQAGEVDAIVTGSGAARRVFTLRTADEPYRQLVESMSEGAALLDGSGLITYANHRLAELLELPLERLLGKSLLDFVDIAERARVARRVRLVNASGRLEHLLHTAAGREISVLLGLSALAEGISGVCATVTDLSDQKARQAQTQRLNDELTLRLGQLQRVNFELQQAQRMLSHSALHDGLTGLPNRVVLFDRLEQELADSARARTAVGVLFLDLDDFKRVNDSQGHAAGDQLLKDVAARLTRLVRPGDTVARLAGDEFVVLAKDISGPDALALAARVQATMDDVEAGPSPRSRIGASIGLALSRPGLTAEQLLQQADAAMYQAKRKGGGRWEVFGPELRRRLQHRVTAERRLRDALLDGGVAVRYQPIVALDTGARIGAEALVRLRLADGRLIPPAAFIDVAEETGAVIQLGGTVLREACGQPQQWAQQSGGVWNVSVNVSPRQLAEPAFVDHVHEALEAAHLAPGQLHLEVTEEALMEIRPSLIATLLTLREIGVKIGVDDFGTGFASMSYVRHLPLDFIKVDRAFVAGMLDDAHDLAMVEATLALARRLNLRTVAEGIEHQSQWTTLLQLGCDEGQGYLFGRPEPSERVPAGLHRLPAAGSLGNQREVPEPRLPSPT